jgi:hypothetical protein
MIVAIVIACVLGYGAGAGICAGLLIGRGQQDTENACFTSIIWPLVLPFLATMELTKSLMIGKKAPELPEARVHR